MTTKIRTAPVDVFPHPTKNEARIFYYEARSERAEGEDKPLITYTGNSDEEDRYGSIVSPRGAITEPYMRAGAGPVLWAHDYSTPPVGKTVKLTKSAKALTFLVEFATQQSEFAREIYELVRDGFLPGVSIGFIPIKAEEYEATTVNSYFAENKKYTEWELLELSVVPVPACRGALKKAYADGKLSDKTIELAHLRNFIQSDGPLFLTRSTVAARSETPAEEKPKVTEPKDETPEPKVEEPKPDVPNGKQLTAIGKMRDWVYVNEQEELEIDDAEREREIGVMNALAKSYVQQIEIGINGWMESKHGALRGICRGAVMNGMWNFDDIRAYMKAWYGQSPEASLEQTTEKAISDTFAEQRAARSLKLTLNVSANHFTDEMIEKITKSLATNRPQIVTTGTAVIEPVSVKGIIDGIAELRKGAKLSKKNKEELLKVLEILQNLDGLNEAADEEETNETEGTDNDAGTTDTGSGGAEGSGTELVGDTSGTKNVAGEKRNVTDIATFLRQGLKLGASNDGGVTESSRSKDSADGEQHGSETASPPKRSYLEYLIDRK